MIETDQDRAETSSSSGENRHGKRTPKTIRFSESEWKRIKTAATERGISIGGFVRDAALARTEGPSGQELTQALAGIEELIKHTFRYAFILTSIKRDELILDGRTSVVDDAVDRARTAQAELLVPNRNSDC